MTYDTINDAQTLAGNGEGTLLAGRYRIVRQLGSGGMGSVWLAEDTQLDNKQFAIKMLPAILVANKRAYRQLKDEALVAMKLTHPNIVTLRAFEENNGNPFLVMDYIDGETLDDYLCERGTGNGERGNGLSEEETIRILRPIAAALDYAHGEGVVHRDVKPANVMIRKDGHPFILDFGIAREIQETMTRVTGKLSSGTLLYMSPEQLRGQPPKAAQDIYSFAAMAYECLKGEPPFPRGQIEYQILNEQPEPLAGRDTPITPLAAGVMAGLAKKPEERPSSCTAVLEGKILSRVEHVERVEGGTDSIKPPSVVSRVPRDRLDGNVSRGDAKARSVGAGKVLVILVLLAALAGGVWWMRVGNVTNATNGASGTPPSETGQTEVDVTHVAVEAQVQKSHVERVDDADGFAKKKGDLADILTRATAYRNERQWEQAAFAYTNYIDGCNALLELDRERQGAIAKRKEAMEARQKAQDANAEKYAVAAPIWKGAENLLSSANIAFGDMRFMEARDAFAMIARQFSQCADEAKTERERQEAAAVAKEKGKQEAVAVVTNTTELQRRWNEKHGIKETVGGNGMPISSDVVGEYTAAEAMEITSEDWRKAQKALKFDRPAFFKKEDGTMRSSVNINGNIYVDGDLVSFTHDGIRFTWRLGLIDKDNKIKLMRVRAQQLKNTEYKQTEDSDKAKSLQNAKAALEVLATDPWRYESVSMKLTQDQRDLLSPVFQEITRGESGLKELLEVYTELNPKVVRARQLQQERLSKFKTLVNKLKVSVQSKVMTWNKSLLNARSVTARAAGTRGGSSYGDASTESMVMGALWWLYGRQNPNGSWGKDEDKSRTNSITALALLTFLAHGEGYVPAKSNQEDFAKTVNSAMRYLISSMITDNGYSNALLHCDDRMKSSFLLMVYALCEAYGMTGDKECGEVANSCLEKIIASVSQEPIRKITCESGMETFFSSRLACMALCMGDFVGLHPENIGDCKNGLIKGLSKIFDCDPRGITLQEFLGALSCLSICNRIDSMWPPLSNSLNYYEPGNLPTDFNYNITEYCYYAGMKDDAKRSDELLWQNWNVKMKKFYADECIVLSDKIVDSKGKSHPQRYWNRNKASQDDYVLAETCMTALQLMVYYRYPASLSTDRE